MATARQIAANRVNSRASTGPRSGAGKAKSAQNARRHGLSLPILTDPRFAPEIEELALEIAGDDAPLEIRTLAFAIAESQVDLFRIRQARCHYIEDALTPYDLLLPANRRALLKQLMDLNERGEGLLFDFEIPRNLVVSDLVGVLNRMDRYERRALSRRKAAIAAFDAARALPT